MERDASGALEIQGFVAPRFERVKDALERSFRDLGDVGASLSVVVDGEAVVDAWGGYADAARTRPWERDTIVNVYSTTKGITAVAAALLADQGKLDPEAPTSAYWPEFGRSGKRKLPVKWLLSHEAGLPIVEGPLPDGAALDWETMVHALEAQAPIWEPGTAMGYHAITYGWLVGEVIRRIAGRSVGVYVRDALAKPLGVDLFIGTPESEDARIAEMIPAPTGSRSPLGRDNPLAANVGRLMAPPLGAGVNTREWRAAELPAANGHTNARALARLYGALARGGEIDRVQLLSADGVEAAAREQVAGTDCVLDMDVRRSLGFILSSPGGRYEWGPGTRTFGHSGAGGSLGFADPDRRVGFGYAMNRMSAGLDADPRWKPLIDAVYASL